LGFQDGLTDFGVFYERTYRAAFRVAYGIVGERGMAEDVTQDAYVDAYRQRGRFRGDGSPDAWLYRIVVNGATSRGLRRDLLVRHRCVVLSRCTERPFGTTRSSSG
jgi:DNA-directed RNA polymerase specialized sigma24 family protein